jgi:RNA polymerase sigma factor (sigma-70 family)
MVRRSVTYFEQFYCRNRGYVHHLLAKFGVPGRDVEDLGHEVFLIAMRKLPQLALQLSSERLWLGRIAYHLARAERRRAFRRLEIPASHRQDLEALGARNDAGGSEVAALARAALSRLGPREVDMLYLHLIGEVSFRRLGQICECDPKTARKRVVTALRRARAVIGSRRGYSQRRAVATQRHP